jgi:hypothetical protein
VNDKPGKCAKCGGSGLYRWGPRIQGVPSKIGKCYSCGGSGRQTRKQIARNRTYNVHAYERDLFD